MRPAPPRGAVSAQFWFRCAAFHELSGGVVFWLGPMPSECPTCATNAAELDVQSAQVDPAAARHPPLQPQVGEHHGPERAVTSGRVGPNDALGRDHRPLLRPLPDRTSVDRREP